MMDALSHRSPSELSRPSKRACWDVPSPVDLTISPPYTGHLQSSLAETMRGLQEANGPPSPAFSVGSSSAAAAFTASRKPREFIPDQKKDDCYWDRRRRNNEAAKRSREKRRISDMVLETRVLELTRENAILRAELFAMKDKFGLSPSQNFIDPDSVSLPLPENSCRGRRNKLLSTIIVGTNNYLEGTHPSLCGNYEQAGSPQSSSSSLSDRAAHHHHLISGGGSPQHLGNSQNAIISVTSPLTNDHRRGGSGHNQQQQQHRASGGRPRSPPSPHAHQPQPPTSNSSLPHKLRHKARNAPNDSDSERAESAVNVASEADRSGDLPSEEAKPIGEILRPTTNLKQENFTLRQELQRLATEVSALKHYLNPLNAYGNGEVRDMGGDHPQTETSPTSPEPVDSDGQQASDRVSTVSCSSESGFSSEDAGSQRDND